MGGKALRVVLLAGFVGGCEGGAPTTSDAASADGKSDDGEADGGARADSSVPGDFDIDGINDEEEARIAGAYLPFLSMSPTDVCPLSGIIYRLRPHPEDATKIFILYDQLYERDCGLLAHVGDNEGFGVTVDPKRPAPDGIIAIKAISHQDTPCQTISVCGTCSGLPACETETGRPILFCSRNKHASYARMTPCTLSFCGEQCTRATSPTSPPLVNVGEPDARLVENLTRDGFITTENGWTAQSLFDFDPWDPAITFGEAGNVYGDLVDARFVSPTCN